MIATRSQSRSASRMMCVENMMHLPWSRSSAIASNSARATSTSRPVVASSKISTGGSCTIARAIDTFCFMPVDIFGPEHVANLLHLEPLEQLLHPLAELLFVHAVEPAEVFDHFAGGHAVVNRRVGGDVADLVPHELGLRDAIEAADNRRAAGRLEHRAENPQRGGFAGAVRSQQAVDLAPAGPKAEAVERHHPPRRRSEYAFESDRASIMAWRRPWSSKVGGVTRGAKRRQ